MKKNILKATASVLCAAAITACAPVPSNQIDAADQKARTAIPADSIIQLTEPDKTLDVTLMQALGDRKSQREFSDSLISLEELSSLLWAANGINREDGKRTAPSAVNSQDIDIYVCTADGAYLYDASQSRLVRITTENLCPAICGQQQLDATLFLVMVADLSRYPEGLASQREVVEKLACMDAGYVSGNICLYCAAAHLATVPRASMDKDALARALNLKDTQIPVLNNPVGYAKDQADYSPAIDAYLTQEIGSQYAKGKYCVPFYTIIGLDESNEDDIKVWGDFWVFNYNHVGDTLKCVSGGSHPGLMHIRKTGSRFAVASFDPVEDGSDNVPSAKRIFGDKYDTFQTVNSDDARREKLRAKVLAQYVRKHDIQATMYQDYGWPAKKLE